MESEQLMPVTSRREDSCCRCRIPDLSVDAVLFLYYLYYCGTVPLISQFVHHQYQLQYGVVEATDPYNATNMSNHLAGPVEAESSLLLMYMNIANTVPAFFSSILIGGYSDYAGRKIAMVVPLTGAALRLLCFIFVFAYQLDLWLLILASLLDGIGGGNSAMRLACHAYVTDSTEQEGRSSRVVILDIISCFAVVVSLLVTGSTLEYLGYIWTLVVVLGAITVTLTYVVFILPESYSSDGVENVRLFNTQHFIRLWRLVAEKDESTGRHWVMRFSLCLTLLVNAIQMGRLDVEALTMMSPPLSFDALWIGYFYAAAFFIMSVGMGLMTYLTARCFDDLALVTIGLISGIGYQVAFGLSTSKLMLFMSPVAGCASLLPMPILFAYCSKKVEQSEMGTMFAGLCWFQAFGHLLGNCVHNAVFAATAHFSERFVFFLGAGAYLLLLLSVICFTIFTYRRGWNSKRVEAINEGG